jgi:hypothetical protein
MEKSSADVSIRRSAVRRVGRQSRDTEETTMRFMMLVKASPESESGVMPDSPDVFEEMGKYNEELVKAGVLLAGDGLQPSSKGARVRFEADGKTTVIDGPFAETKELIAGFWIIQVQSREEALEWASRAPFPEGEELEVRQVFEASDFEGVMSPEAIAREQELRDQIAGS